MCRDITQDSGELYFWILLMPWYICSVFSPVKNFLIGRLGRYLGLNSNYVIFTDDNFTVKKNSNVIIPILMVHRNPNIYPNPMQWNPDNFSPNMVESRHKYSFLAFSGGARGCIGL